MEDVRENTSKSMDGLKTQKSGGAAIPMRQNSIKTIPADLNITCLTGSAEIIEQMQEKRAFKPFDEAIITFLDAISKALRRDLGARQYPDVVTFGFWCRKASIMEQKKKNAIRTENRLGRGIIFHIAPSNVPVNFAYSMAAGLLAGNANIVRVPSKDFEQVSIIADAINSVLNEEVGKSLKGYLALIRYGHDDKVTEYLSAICDTRVIWGGDETIRAIRKSPLKPRANEITFADRYSLAVIDADDYLKSEDKKSIATGFYNDTYLTDQNACTSPRIVIWLGEEKEKAKEQFWEELYQLVQDQYMIQPVQAVSKRESFFRLAALLEGTKLIQGKDNRLVLVQVPRLTPDLMVFKNNSGYFFEYDAQAISEIFLLCNDSQCQTIGYYGGVKETIQEFLFEERPKGVDRVVPVGKTMDFELVWDGVELINQMSRIIGR